MSSLDWSGHRSRERASSGSREVAVSPERAPVRFSPEGIPAIHGVVNFVSPGILGVRASDALYRFLFPAGVVYLGHHIRRDDVDVQATRAAWQAWLDRSSA